METTLDYKPEPIDTSRVSLSPDIAKLSEVLARNAHENWAKLRIAEGWRHGICRSDKRKEHANLVPYEQLPELEKEYDRRNALETIKTLLAMGYTIEKGLGPQVASRSTLSGTEGELASVLQKLKDPVRQDLASMQELWRSHDPDVWSASPEIYRIFGDRVLKLGQPLIAYDVAAEGIKSFSTNVPLRQLLALALARSGAAEAANAVLVGLYQEGHRDEETLGLMARINKDLASEEPDVEKARKYWRQAYELYEQAYQTTGSYWGGINAATLALRLGERQQAVNLARQVRKECRHELARVNGSVRDHYWLLSTLGEAALLLGEWSEAEEFYGQAIEAGSGDWGDLQSTRHNARLLMQYLETDANRIERLFRFPTVVVFTGHMVDRPDRANPRFPPQLEPALKDAIRQRLRQLNAGFGFASVACGSDILFHESILEMNGESHVVLPYERGPFIRDSVEVAGSGNWVGRCERIIARACEVQEVSTESQMRTTVAYEFANLMLHGLASVRAQQLETNLVPIAVWDGESGTRLGGTAHTVERWRRLGLHVEIIRLDEILRRNYPLDRRAYPSPLAPSRVATEFASEFESEIRALLFADVEGFSKLTDDQIPRFAHHFLCLAGKLAAESPHPPLTKNTWGDGLYLVFSNVRDAGHFALDLRDAVRNTDWSTKQLPPLSLRIGLHAGPVYCCCDPVTQRSNYIGAHVSRAARIEPITPTGQVYASQAFAALAAAEGVREFRCDYVGQTAMAKKYGTFPTYVVLRRRMVPTGTL